MDGESVHGVILRALGETVAACKVAAGVDELLDRRVGPAVSEIAVRAERDILAALARRRGRQDAPDDLPAT